MMLRLSSERMTKVVIRKVRWLRKKDGMLGEGEYCKAVVPVKEQQHGSVG